ncbi:MAG: redoxin family protein [Chthonomonadaceae bacterium]|nr:redoxin family protein [Chthonomonadaceae bacterium]
MRSITQKRGAVKTWLPAVSLIAIILAVLGRMMFYTPPAVKDGSLAPDMTLSNPGEPVVRLSEKRGKVIVLDFWATWCGPCKQSMPHLSKIYENWKADGVEVYGISTDLEDRRKLVPVVAKDLGVTYPLLYFLDQPDLNEKYHWTSLPTMVIINKKGEVVKYQQGYDPSYDLDAIIGALVKEKG